MVTMEEGGREGVVSKRGFRLMMEMMMMMMMI